MSQENRYTYRLAELKQIYLLLGLLVITIACNTPQTPPLKHPEGQKLANLHCQGCHELPHPSSLDKLTWKNEVLPKMGLQLGLNLADEAYKNALIADSLYPPKAALGREDWLKIMNYFIDNAPLFSKSQASNLPIELELPHFNAQEAPIQLTPLTTLIQLSKFHSHILLGNATGESLYMLDSSFQELHRFELAGAPSCVIEEKNRLYVLAMGQVMPHNKAIGSLSLIARETDTSYAAPKVLIDNLKRPVDAAIADFDQDGKDDIVIASFGNLSGELALYFDFRSVNRERLVLKALPGASRTILRDWDKDGDMDILALMAQGQEGIYLYSNQGKKQFTESPLLKFPPSYGSTYFDLVDFNEDGREDILYVNGDNGDYLPVMKDYHGTRIYLQDGEGKFSESSFLPQNGAFKAISTDFDQDGDLDIAVNSYFPDYKKRPHESFIYYQNQGKMDFKPYSFPESIDGKWLCMTAGDIDRDGDTDLLLGSGLFMRDGASNEIKARWRKHAPPLFVLYNQVPEKQE
ncbi:MAG: VCBS repeat-containing protein [Bacteroidota bacterium]